MQKLLEIHIEKEKYELLIDHKRQKEVEHMVSTYIQTHFHFVVFSVPRKEDRLKLESRIISTVSRCQSCRPSSEWLGLHSPKKKIKESGLWIVNELYKRPLMQSEFDDLCRLID